MRRLSGPKSVFRIGSTRTLEEPKKLDRALLLSPQLKLIYEHKEKFRAIFNQHLTREQGEIALTQWIEEAKKMKNNYLNKFLYMLNDWKEYVLNYFTYRVTTSVIEGINNSIKTVKRMGYGFRNLVLRGFLWRPSQPRADMFLTI